MAINLLILPLPMKRIAFLHYGNSRRTVTTKIVVVQMQL